MSTLMIMSLAVCAVLIALEHISLARLLAHNELARRVIGVATVLACAAIPVVAGEIPALAWVFFVALFAVAGAVVYAFVTFEDAAARHSNVERLRDVIAETRDRDV